MLFFKQLRIAFLKAYMTKRSISSEACNSFLSCIYEALGLKKLKKSDLLPSEFFQTGGYRITAS